MCIARRTIIDMLHRPNETFIAYIAKEARFTIIL